jgi:hypothetical protein
VTNMMTINVLQSAKIRPPKKAVAVKSGGLVAFVGGAIICSVGAAICIADSPAASRLFVSEIWAVSGLVVCSIAFFLDRR